MLTLNTDFFREDRTRYWSCLKSRGRAQAPTCLILYLFRPQLKARKQLVSWRQSLCCESHLRLFKGLVNCFSAGHCSNFQWSSSQKLAGLHGKRPRSFPNPSSSWYIITWWGRPLHRGLWIWLSMPEVEPWWRNWGAICFYCAPVRVSGTGSRRVPYWEDCGSSQD